MIKENQKIEIYIPRQNIAQYYREKGYDCKTGQTIVIDAKDISSGSHKKIDYICDYCGAQFSRVVYSNERQKDNSKDSCSKCSAEKRKETSLKRFGVDNAMKLEEYQLKCEQSKINNNFDGSKNFSCTYFVNGIPVSQGQANLSKLFPNFKLNYHYRKYYLDLVYNNIAIEYDGKGHDLGVRMNKISLEDFLTNEKIKEKQILGQYRLLRIIDPKDRLRNKENITSAIITQINDFINSEIKYSKIEIK